MSQLNSSGQLLPEIELQPAKPNLSLRYGLSQETFDAWWNAIPLQDREGFRFHGGDSLLARFVCAFEVLTKQTGASRPARMNAITQAYAVATGTDPTLNENRVRAGRAFEHRAAQYMFDQFEYRADRMVREAIRPRYTQLLERILDDALAIDTPLGDRVKAAGSIQKFYSTLSSEDMQERNTRNRKSTQKALDIVIDHKDDDLKLSDDQLKSHVEELARSLGTEKMLALVAATQQIKEQDMDMPDMTESDE